jgi:CRISPR-associated protein Csx16
MTTYLVTRHPGALHWMRAHGPAFDQHLTHLDPTSVQAGDTVIGTLPIQLAAQVCARGARYLHLTTNIPAQWRGQELSAEQLDEAQAHLQEFFVQPRP